MLVVKEMAVLRASRGLRRPARCCGLRGSQCLEALDRVGEKRVGGAEDEHGNGRTAVQRISFSGLTPVRLVEEALAGAEDGIEEGLAAFEDAGEVECPSACASSRIEGDEERDLQPAVE